MELNYRRVRIKSSKEDIIQLTKRLGVTSERDDLRALIIDLKALILILLGIILESKGLIRQARKLYQRK